MKSLPEEEEKVEQVSDKSSKRKAVDSPSKGGDKKKKVEDVDVEDFFKKGMVMKLTVPILSQFLKSKGLKPVKKKVTESLVY